MEKNTTNAVTSSDAVRTETKGCYDFRSQLNLSVESEWAKANTNILDKKKAKSKKCKAAKKSSASSDRQF